MVFRYGNRGLVIKPYRCPIQAVCDEPWNQRSKCPPAYSALDESDDATSDKRKTRHEERGRPEGKGIDEL